jgi:hypothetical protein
VPHPESAAERTQEIVLSWIRGHGPHVEVAPTRGLANRTFLPELPRDPADPTVILLPGAIRRAYLEGAPHPSHPDAVYLHRVP